MTDYAAWLSRLATFAVACAGNAGFQWRFAAAPPLDESRLVLDAFPSGLPSPLHAFLTTAGEFDIEIYTDLRWDAGTSWISGHSTESFAAVGSITLQRILEGAAFLREYADEPLEGGESSEIRLAKGSVPFMPLTDGSWLVLDIASPQMIVWHFAPHGGSTPLCDGFDSFLERWERICYLMPNLWTYAYECKEDETAGTYSTIAHDHAIISVRTAGALARRLGGDDTA